MIKRKLGKGDLEISPVILGTWALGGWLWGGTEKNDAEKAINCSLDAGINCIDTAPVYGFGLSEKLVGRAIKGRRQEVIIATKCGLVWDGREGSTPFFDSVDLQGNPIQTARCLRKKSILAECDESLLRLGIDEIDLYQCHWPDEGTPIDETMEAMQILKDKGKIREVGVSNFNVEQLKESSSYLTISSDQPKYSLLSREIEKDVLPYCYENNIGVLAYSPMEMGLLTGKISVDHEFPDDDTRKTRPWFTREKRQEVLDALEKIRPIADKYNTNFAQISVAWVTAQPGITAAIVGARNSNQAESNAVAADIVLEQADVDAITETFNDVVLDEPFDPANAKR